MLAQTPRRAVMYTELVLNKHTQALLDYPTVRACAVGITNLHTSSVLYWNCGTVQSLCSWSATTCTTWTLLEHQVLTPRTPRAVGSPLVPDPDQVSKYASLVPRPRH